MFDKEFFKRNQKILLWLLNTPIIKMWFRWVMCIDQKAKIDRIDPNATFWKKENNKVGFDIRTHQKYSKRLYYGFYYVWATAHFLDMNLINHFVPKWNLGFDSFGPIYPDAGTGGTTVDGSVYRTSANSTFSSLRSGVGTAVRKTESYSRIIYLDTSYSSSDRFTYMERGIFTFDTSSIPEEDKIDEATISFYKAGQAYYDLGDDSINIVSSDPTSNNDIVTGDYIHTKFGETSYSAKDLSSIGTGYEDFSLNDYGKLNITKEGISKFGVRLGWDLNNSFGGTWIAYKFNEYVVYLADNTGTTKDPKLSGEFSSISLSNFFLIF